jgi:phenylalanyl-tRNA synthetase beta chain
VRVPYSGGEAAGRQAILDALAGMGFIECVTHSLISVKAANQFLSDGQTPLTIDDDRATAEPALRPSLIPSLLTVRKHNEDNGVKNLYLAELGSVFALEGDTHEEHTELALVMDAKEEESTGKIRGVIDRLCSILTGLDNVSVSLNENAPWLEPGGDIVAQGTIIGRVGRLSTSAQKNWDLPMTLHVAQLYIDTLLSNFPPDVQSHPLPKQPAIERDITIILDESVMWSSLQEAITSLNLEHLENVSFVTTFRGKNVGVDKKSLTLKLRFRDLLRTLTHDEVDVPTTTAIKMLTEQFSAEIRS